MAQQKNPQDTPEKSPRELEERQLEQASGGRATLSDISFVKKQDKASPS
jgi:hypothetical protein